MMTPSLLGRPEASVTGLALQPFDPELRNPNGAAGGLKTEQVKRLKDLEVENACLRRAARQTEPRLRSAPFVSARCVMSADDPIKPR